MFPWEGRDSWSFFPLYQFAVDGVFTGQLPPRVASPTSTTLSLWMWEIGRPASSRIVMCAQEQHHDMMYVPYWPISFKFGPE